jgi:hypothetical protein
VQAYAADTRDTAYSASQTRFDTIVDWLYSPGATTTMTHAQLEERLHTDGLELVAQLLQDSLDLRASREQRLSEVCDSSAVARATAEPGRTRTLATVFGDVHVSRIAYRCRGLPDLHPADAGLNLPTEQHSHGLRRMAAVEATRGSFDAASAAITRNTGVKVGKRQVKELTERAATDVDAFYTTHTADTGGEVTDALVLQFDAKGVVMRPDSLRGHTKKKATSRKLSSRLSRGEKRDRKRMAEVGAVYDLTPQSRTIADILPDSDTPRPAPATHNKWLTASVTDDAAQVITAGFDEATRRDPEHHRDWVALVDGNTHQIARIRAEARARDLTVPIVIDFIHVVEYLWKAAWCFFTEGDKQVEAWVREQAKAILAGRASIVAAAIRRKATYHGLDPGRRKPADICATYLINKKPHLDYPTALANGWPIATGVIEGACRHLVADRMDITGARWSLNSAEAVLKLRALISNGDFDTYWTFHLAQEQQRIHNARYLDSIIPTR